MIDTLRQLGACKEAVEWASTHPDAPSAWNACPRGDWMLWVVARGGMCSRKELVAAACECARLALPYTQDPRVLECIEATEAWTRGEATLEEVRAAAANAAYAANVAANATPLATAHRAIDLFQQFTGHTDQPVEAPVVQAAVERMLATT